MYYLKKLQHKKFKKKEKNNNSRKTGIVIKVEKIKL